MAYNLTPAQKRALRWLVEKTKEGELGEGDVRYSYSTSGGAAVQLEKPNIELPDYITGGVFEVLHKEDLVHISKQGRGSYVVALRGEAYQAVNNDFEGRERPATGGQTIFNVGDMQDNSRINFQSRDKSTNIVDKSADELFAELRRVIEQQITNDPEKEKLLDSIREMEQAESKSSYLKAYGFFIGLAASHVEVLDPFLGALWQLYQSL